MGGSGDRERRSRQEKLRGAFARGGALPRGTPRHIRLCMRALTAMTYVLHALLHPLWLAPRAAAGHTHGNDRYHHMSVDRRVASEVVLQPLRAICVPASRPAPRVFLIYAARLSSRAPDVWRYVRQLDGQGECDEEAVEQAKRKKLPGGERRVLLREEEVEASN